MLQTTHLYGGLVGVQTGPGYVPRPQQQHVLPTCSGWRKAQHTLLKSKARNRMINFIGSRFDTRSFQTIGSTTDFGFLHRPTTRGTTGSASGCARRRTSPPRGRTGGGFYTIHVVRGVLTQEHTRVYMPSRVTQRGHNPQPPAKPRSSGGRSGARTGRSRGSASCAATASNGNTGTPAPSRRDNNGG